MRFVVLIVLFLSGCATGSQKPVDISDVDLNNLHLVGYYTTYSEVCGQKLAVSAPREKIVALTEEFRGVPWFDSGYVINRSALNADVITGFGKCYKARDVVNAAYDKHISNLEQTEVTFRKGGTYQMTISWETQFIQEFKAPMRVTNVGKKTSTGKSTTLSSRGLFPGKTCYLLLSFEEEEDEAGDWYLKCLDGPSADGYYQKEKYVTATGSDSEGNRVAFSITHKRR
jgi:hypothetical protein